jgi:hypothetical protein
MFFPKLLGGGTRLSGKIAHVYMLGTQKLIPLCVTANQIWTPLHTTKSNFNVKKPKKRKLNVLCTVKPVLTSKQQSPVYNGQLEP